MGLKGLQKGVKNCFTLHYIQDDSLEFLQYASDEQLQLLVGIFLAQPTQTLTYQKDYKRYKGKHHRYWELIAAQLQNFGGDTIANTLRGHGKKYKDILIQVCKNEGVKFDKHADTAQIEKLFVHSQLQKVSPEIEKRTHLHKKDLYESIFYDHRFYKRVLQDLSVTLNKRSYKRLAKYMAPPVLRHFTKRLTPLWVLILALMVKDISSHATRVTYKAIFVVAYLRQQHTVWDMKIRKRYYPKVGSIVVTDLVKGLIEHSGIYIGGGKIVEVYNDKKKAVIKKVGYYDFVSASMYRTGSSINIAVDKKTQKPIYHHNLAVRAKSYLNRTKEYELLLDNCHSFVYKMIKGVAFEKYTEVVLFKELHEAIEDELNGGKEIEWVVCDINPFVRD